MVLLLVVLAAVLLRVWGLGWGPPGAGALHPGEWTWQVIDSLSFSDPTFPGIWTQAFFSLAALLKGFLSLLAGVAQLLLGHVRSLAEVGISARIAGRLTVAMLGSLQVVLVYVLGRRYFDSVATGLLAAALVAVSPLMVAHSHYLALDVPLGLAVLGCMWAAYVMVDRPRAAVMALAGLILGLTITTRASGVLVAPVLAGAYVLAVRVARPARSRWALIWPAAFAGGLVAGLLLGYPGFLLRADQTEQVLQSSLVLPPVPSGEWLAFFAERCRRSAAVALESVGLPVLVLWLLGVVLVARRRLWRRALLLVFPPLYCLAGLVVLKGSVEGVSAVWLPVLAVVAVWPVVWACRRLPRHNLAVAAAAILGAGLCAWPLWRTLGVDYLFWQQDTLTSARLWVEANLDRDSELWVGPHTPVGLFLPVKPLTPQVDPAELNPGSFVLLSSLGAGAQADAWEDFRSPQTRDAWGRLTANMQPLAVFDLKTLWSAGPKHPDAGLPRWVSPRVQVFSARPPLQVSQPLAVFKPPALEDRQYTVVYGDWDRYSRSQGVMRLGPGADAERVLIMQPPPRRLGLIIANRGDRLAQVSVAQGPWPSRRLSLYPGQEADLSLPVLPWPPVVEGSHPVSIKTSDSHLVARLVWDELLLGRRALESGRLKEAVDILKPLEDKGGGVEAGIMLAGALAMQGRYELASRALAGISGLNGEPLHSYRDLADARGLSRKEWDRRFRQATGYHPDLLRRACSLTYLVGGPQCPSLGREVPLKGRGFHASYLRTGGRPGGHLRLWLEQSFPPGRLRVDLHLSVKGHPPADQKLARMEVWSHGPQGSERLADRSISAEQAARGPVGVGFLNPHSGSSLEVRLLFTSGEDLALERVVAGVDLRAHMSHMLRWYHLAMGKVSLAAGRFAAAVSSFSELLDLDPGFSEAYLPLAQALLDAGRVKEALILLRQAEGLFSSQPGPLARVGELYGSMQKPQDVARVEKRLAHLRPSLKKQARFGGGLTLLGYDLSQAKVAPGGSLDVSYYWRCWSPPPVNYFVFVHLRGPKVIYNYDHLLDHGQRSMTTLRPGEVVREDYRITVPSDAPPGTYRLVVGLWDPQFTGKGVPVLEGEGAGSEEVRLATVQVE